MTLIFFGRIAQAALALLALRIMTTLLSPEEMGRWSLLLAVTSFFVLAFVSPLGMFINRRLHAWVEHGKINQYMIYYLLYLSGVALFAALLFYISNYYYVAVPGMPLSWVLALIICSIFFATINQTFIPSLNLLGYRGWFIILTLGTVIVGLISSVLFVHWIDPKAELWQAGQLTGQAVLAIVGGFVFFHFARKHKKSTSSSEVLLITSAKVSAVYSFTWPLVISVLLIWVQSQSYRFIVHDVIGLEALGLFIVGYGVSASLIGIFESITSTYFVPAFYKRTSSEDKREQALAWHEYASAMLPSLLVIIAVIIATSGELAFVLLDAKFAEAAQYIVWGALAETARVAVSTYALVAHAGMNTRKLIIPNVISAIAAPLFVFLFVSNWAAHGVGLGLAAAGFIAIISSHLVLSRSFEIIMPWSNLLWTGVISLVLIAFAEVTHGLLGISETFTASFCWLVVAGLLLLSVLYYFLKPEIDRGAA